MAQTAAPPRPTAEVRGPGYDQDFVLWSQHQAALIRRGRLDLIDRENVALEIESLGKRDRRQLGHRLEVLLMHLLQWQFEPAARSGSWRGTIRTQRGRILRLLRDSPSLGRQVAAEAENAHPRAAANVADEAGLDLDRLPPACPYTDDELLNDDFWPEFTERP